MPFVRQKGIEGLVFVPENCPACDKKHDCPDCFSCRQCSDESCRVCLRSAKCKSKDRKHPLESRTHRPGK